MRNYQYTLEPYKNHQSRHSCPSCGKTHSFVRYVDTMTRQYLNDNVGRCNHESKCGYHYTPKQYFKDNSIEPIRLPIPVIKEIIPKQTSFISPSLLRQSLKYHENNFILYLTSIFNPDIVSNLIAKYFIGSSKHWPGATVFWQIDKSGKIRTGKIMLYDPKSGKRTKYPYNHITWVHRVLKISDFNLCQCLFGEHLLSSDSNRPIAIVESEKTAIIASIYFPQFIWLATGSKMGFKAVTLESLRNRRVFAFPDLGAYDDWHKKSSMFNLNISVSDYLEKKASEFDKKCGLDLADYLVKFNYVDFIKEISINSNPY